MGRIRIARALGAFACIAAAAEADLIDVDTKVKPADAAWKPRPTQVLERLEGYAPGGPPSLGRYGGWAAARQPATGFFHARKLGDRWWLIDPDGLLFQSRGVASTAPGGGARAGSAFAKAFGGNPAWADSTGAALRGWGFNSAGAWSSGTALADGKHPVAYAPVWNFMTGYGGERGGLTQQPGHAGYPNDAIFVFDPGFEAYCEKQAQKLAARKDDPWLIGHFSDNELPWPVDMLAKFLALPATEPGRKAAQAWLDARKGKPSAAAADIVPADEEAFRFFAAERYFSLVSKAIRRHDPNHLYLGARFHGWSLRDSQVVKAAGRHCDVVSFNWYGAWTPDSARMRSWEAWSGKPFLITEWYAKGADAVGLANTSGAGWLVRTQADRGRFYQNFALALLRAKGCVGWHWFKYQDNDPEAGGDPSNQDSNKGIVDIGYMPYGDLVSSMRALNAEAYALTEFFDGRKWTGLASGTRGSPERKGAAASARVWTIGDAAAVRRDARGRDAREPRRR